MKPILHLSALAIGILALALLAGACAPAATTPAPTPAGSIQGIVWRWESVTNQTTRETTTVPNPEDYTITFNADGTLGGKADCNNFTGTYSQESGLTITLGDSTLAFCGCLPVLRSRFQPLLNRLSPKPWAL